MEILFADSCPETHRQQLTDAGHQCRFEPQLTDQDLPSAIANAEILVVRSTKVTAEAMDAAPQLKLIIRAGAGTNTIDKAHAANKDIAVCNVPGANALAVAELAMGLIISLDRRLPSNDQDLKAGKWDKKGYSKARGLYGQTLGILGCGAIGLALAERAHAFGIKLCTVNKSNRDAATSARMQAIGMAQLDSLDDVLAQSSIVSIHLPANDDTKNMVNADFLGKMQDGAMLINTSRGELVDESALLAALDSKGLVAGLDVYQNEPGAADNEFKSQIASHASVVGTHHIGASTTQAQTAVSDGMIAVIESYEAGAPINRVN